MRLKSCNCGSTPAARHSVSHLYLVQGLGSDRSEVRVGGPMSDERGVVRGAIHGAPLQVRSPCHAASGGQSCPTDDDEHCVGEPAAGVLPLATPVCAVFCGRHVRHVRAGLSSRAGHHALRMCLAAVACGRRRAGQARVAVTCVGMCLCQGGIPVPRLMCLSACALWALQE